MYIVLTALPAGTTPHTSPHRLRKEAPLTSHPAQQSTDTENPAEDVPMKPWQGVSVLFMDSDSEHVEHGLVLSQVTARCPPLLKESKIAALMLLQDSMDLSSRF